MRKPHYYCVHWTGPDLDKKGRPALHSKDFKTEKSANQYAEKLDNFSVYAATVENIHGISFAHLDKLSSRRVVIDAGTGKPVTKEQVAKRFAEGVK